MAYLTILIEGLPRCPLVSANQNKRLQFIEEDLYELLEESGNKYFAVFSALNQITPPPKRLLALQPQPQGVHIVPEADDLLFQVFQLHLLNTSSPPCSLHHLNAFGLSFHTVQMPVASLWMKLCFGFSSPTLLANSTSYFAMQFPFAQKFSKPKFIIHELRPLRWYPPLQLLGVKSN